MVILCFGPAQQDCNVFIIFINSYIYIYLYLFTHFVQLKSNNRVIGSHTGFCLRRPLAADDSPFLESFLRFCVFFDDFCQLVISKHVHTLSRTFKNTDFSTCFDDFCQFG